MQSNKTWTAQRNTQGRRQARKQYDTKFNWKTRLCIHTETHRGLTRGVEITGEQETGETNKR